MKKTIKFVKENLLETEAHKNFRSAQDLYILICKELEALEQRVIVVTLQKEFAKKVMDSAERVFVEAREIHNGLKAKIS